MKNLFILIAENHSVTRIGIKMIMKEMYPQAVIKEAGSFEEVIILMHQFKIDLLILEIQIPGGDNLKMVEIIRIKQVDIRVLIFSNCDEKLFALHYIQVGALGYLQKNCEVSAIRVAIMKVLNNENYISQELQRQFFKGWIPGKDRTLQGITGLSARETEIMHLLIKGCRTNEIKEILNIMPSTISTHKAKIFTKLNVNNVIELAQKVNNEAD